MWTCKKCGKPVYFAERKKSMGYDWHPRCLKCAECGKVLHPGQHAEHKEQPFCHIPCYSALFGPKLFGHGSTVESHQSFGKRSGKKFFVDKEFERKFREYNEQIKKLSGNSKLELTSRLVNGRLVLEGVLRVYWGVQRSIRVKEFEDTRPFAKRQPSVHNNDYETSDHDVVLRRKDDSAKTPTNFYRHSVHQTFQSTQDNIWQRNNFPRWRTESMTSHDIVERTLLHRTLSDSKLDRMSTEVSGLQEYLRSSYQTMPANYGRTKSAVVPLRLGRYEPLSDLSKEILTLKCDFTSLHHQLPNCQGYEESEPSFSDRDVVTKKKTGPRALRRRPGKKFDKNVLKRRSSFNGHWYDRDTSVFTPPKDSCMSVWITSLVQAKEVIQMILDKYKIESEPDRFALFVVKENGERRKVGDAESLLELRVNLGAHEDIARLYIFDRSQTVEVPLEVAQYLRFSYAECRAILNMFYEEEEREVECIKRKYKLLRKSIGNLLITKWTPNDY